MFRFLSGPPARTIPLSSGDLTTMPKPSKDRRHLSAMIRNDVYAMLEEGARLSSRSLTHELEVAIARHRAYPERIVKPPLGDAPPGLDAPPAMGRPPGPASEDAPARKPGKPPARPAPAPPVQGESDVVRKLKAQQQARKPAPKAQDAAERRTSARDDLAALEGESGVQRVSAREEGSCQNADA
jgi:hypothetical protein